MDIIVDTLSLRANFDNFNDLCDFLGVWVGDWNPGNKFNTNYQHSLFYEGIVIGYGGSAGWEYYIHMSGKGCRMFEDISGDDFNWFNFIFKIYLKVKEGSAAVTRIDLAADVFDNSLNLQRIERYILNKKYLTRCSDKSISLIKFGQEIFYVGSPQSVTLLRIYNKKLERGYAPGDTEIPYWYRCELQARDSHAQQIIIEWATSSCIGKIFAGHVMDHFKFLKRENLRDGNQHRIPVARWWSKFLEDAEPIKWVSVKGSEYNMTKLQKYAIGNAGSSVKTMIQAKRMNAEQLYALYTDPLIKLRDDQTAFINKCLKDVTND